MQTAKYMQSICIFKIYANCACLGATVCMRAVPSEHALFAQFILAPCRFPKKQTIHCRSRDRWVCALHIYQKTGFVVMWSLLYVNWVMSRQKTYSKTCATSEDSDQPAHPRSLIRVFADRMCLGQPPGYPKRDKREPLPTLGGCTDWSESLLVQQVVL